MQGFLDLSVEFQAELVFLQVPKIKKKGRAVSVRTKDGLLVKC
jgi:hypothetical protein